MTRRGFTIPAGRNPRCLRRLRLDVERSGSDGVLGLDEEFKGPIAGVTLAF